MEQNLLPTALPTTRQPVSQTATSDRATTARLAGIDRLRVGLTILVIAHHAGQAYGPTGGAWPLFEAQRTPVLGPFFSVNAAFFMGLFFFLAGLFTPGAYDRKGVGGYLRDRLLRLGLPLAILVLGIFPLFSYQAGSGTSFIAYVGSLIVQGKLEFAHLWFVLHLLIYGLLYALWRALGGRRVEAKLEQIPAPGHRSLLGYAVALALVSGLVQNWYSFNIWPRLLGLPFEAAHLPQYLSLFVLGVVAGRAGWVERLPWPVARVWLVVGLVAAALRYIDNLWLHGLTPGILYNVWESLACVGLVVGLVGLAVRVQTVPGPAERTVEGAAYGAYLAHLLVVIGFQVVLLPLPLAPLAKFALVTLAATPVSFGIAAGLRRLPGADRVL
jgi:glucans biosynthesis protein C